MDKADWGRTWWGKGWSCEPCAGFWRPFLDNSWIHSCNQQWQWEIQHVFALGRPFFSRQTIYHRGIYQQTRGKFFLICWTSMVATHGSSDRFWWRGCRLPGFKMGPYDLSMLMPSYSVLHPCTLGEETPVQSRWCLPMSFCPFSHLGKDGWFFHLGSATDRNKLKHRTLVGTGLFFDSPDLVDMDIFWLLMSVVLMKTL